MHPDERKAGYDFFPFGNLVLDDVIKLRKCLPELP
jgi:hypothetical protein